MSAHFHILTLTLHGLLAATKTTKPKTSILGFLPIILIAAALYFLLIRPQRNRVKRQQQEQGGIEVGDEVMLTSGIIGRVVSMAGDRAKIEVAPDIEFEVMRQALGRKLAPPLDDDEIAVDRPDHEGDEGDGQPGDDGVMNEDSKWWPPGHQAHDGDDETKP
jgi:preprotein translocase subunit YajC